MPRNYQLNGKEKLPHDLYMQIMYMIKDYPRMKKEFVDYTYLPEGEQCAEKLAALTQRIKGIDDSIFTFNVNYTEKITRKDVEHFDTLEAFHDFGYFCYTLYNPKKEKEPSYKTWSRFRASFIFMIAANLHIA